MSQSRFVYVTYIRTTPEKLWQALTEHDFIPRYWNGMRQECSWENGADWKLLGGDGEVFDSGRVEAIDPPHRLVLSWRNQRRPELHDEGTGRATFELEPSGANVKLTVTHEIDVADSKLIVAVSGGWPIILSSLKSLLETGEALARAS